MDTQKDIQKDNHIDPIEFFKGDDVFVFVYKKTEKLATAMYMVTNLLSENEPMKWALRKKVGDLLSFMLSYKDILPPEHDNFVHKTKSRILEIVSLLEISSRSGLLSPMNFSILREEFNSVLLRLDHANNSVNSSNSESSFGDRNIPNSEPNRQTLSKGLFDVKTSQSNPTNSPDDKRSAGVIGLYTNSNSQNNLSLNGSLGNPSNVASNLRDISAHNPAHIYASTNNGSSPANNAVIKRNNRQNLILQLLKKKKEVSIKDIAEVVKNCSEKTIQRELISLIQGGVIKKTGERRWSKYSMA
jgi:predicted transcriptional regulator